MISVFIYIIIGLMAILILTLDFFQEIIKEIFVKIPQKVYNKIKENKKNIWGYTWKTIVICLTCWYLITRTIVSCEMGSDVKYRPYTENEIAELKISKVNRYVKLQQKTLFIDRYCNCIYKLLDDDYIRLSGTIIFLTYSHKSHRFLEYIWNRHAELLFQEDRVKYDEYLQKVHWMNEKDKKRITRELEQQNNNTK